MENASKALIIAGAILLAILIISLGILIYNQASGVVNNNAMSEVELNNFNQKFTQYEGVARGTTVRGIYQAVLSNNITQDSTDRQIEVDGPSTMDETDVQLPDDLNENIRTGASYTVSCEMGTDGGEAGLVQVIHITEN